MRGSGFLSLLTLRCRFGDQVVVATWVSPEELWCVSPPGSAQEVDLEVTLQPPNLSALQLLSSSALIPR